ncbi:hypothetical protein Glove_457g22 [Diversispora epigaea]|uniref:SWIM-type domain-containing protein n=1 Tax=Diversispora epigaea TaxID=1348612 RepID=A0A397GP19_9GLOM|nr:hypothetical protein Glove_457g22 [Diversispora epigaea]
MNNSLLYNESSLPFNNTNNNTTETTLYQGKFLIPGSKLLILLKVGQNIKALKNPDGTFRKRTIKYEHQGTYIAKSNEKQTTTKRIGCTWYINLSEPQSKNPFKHVYVTTFHDTHSHILNPSVIQFGNNKNIPSEIMKEIEFLTVQCKMGATTQRQYLEAKFPGQIIYNEDLNDAAKLYTRLLLSSQENPMWKVTIKFDDNNTLTHLFWMSPSQLELWYQFSDIVVQDVTCKTNRYDMALSLFVVLDENQNIRLVAQALLIDETKESHEWSFKQINLATDNMHPRVIMTDSDPAVHAAIRSTFVTTYPMHCTFHISQNLIKKLQKLLGKKFHEFSSWFYDIRNTLHKPIFESKWKNLIRLHASSPVESINAWIKSYIFNSNISLCELANIIDKRQFSEDKNYQLILWKAAIPCKSTHVSTSAFMFFSIDKKLEEYLPLAILELQRNEIRQCVFYDAIQVNQEIINEFDEYNLSDQYLEDMPDARQTTASCMISDVNKEQITSMWAVSVGNKLIEKHFIILLSNNSHHCSCLSLINRGIYNLSDQYLEDMPDARQTTASCMISDVNKEQITSMWAVSVGNKLIEKHFIILLSNNSHHCSCLSLINRGIVCRHYFQIMFRSPIAKFHIRLIPSRWYYKNKDPSKEPFLVATKFEEISIPSIPESNIPFLTAVNHSTLHDSITQHERLTDIQLYGKIAGLTQKVTMKAIKKKDVRIINILEDYFNKVFKKLVMQIPLHLKGTKSKNKEIT